MYKRAEPSVNI